MKYLTVANNFFSYESLEVFEELLANLDKEYSDIREKLNYPTDIAYQERLHDLSNIIEEIKNSIED